MHRPHDAACALRGCGGGGAVPLRRALANHTGESSGGLTEALCSPFSDRQQFGPPLAASNTRPFQVAILAGSANVSDVSVVGCSLPRAPAGSRDGVLGEIMGDAKGQGTAVVDVTFSNVSFDGKCASGPAGFKVNSHVYGLTFACDQDQGTPLPPLTSKLKHAPAAAAQPASKQPSQPTSTTRASTTR
jgi:hypothetical protein